MARRGEQIPDLAALARIYYLSNGIPRMLRPRGKVYYFRAESCTVALYPVELYLGCGNLPGLSACVYYYGAHDHALREMRTGHFREVVVRSTANDTHFARYLHPFAAHDA